MLKNLFRLWGIYVFYVFIDIVMNTDNLLGDVYSLFVDIVYRNCYGSNF